MGRHAGGWQLLIPVKETTRAKSRLALALGEHRPHAALAFALDTVAAALQCVAVDEVTVATNDPRVGLAVGSLGARVTGEGAVPELNQVIAYAVATLPPTAKTAVLLGDLPAITPTELGRALKTADRLGSGFVPDASGTGTTLLTAQQPSQLQPRFGAGSAAAHEAVGVVRIGGRGLSRLRRDVDNLADLVEATRLGVGSRTREWLRQIDVSALEAEQVAPQFVALQLLATEYIAGR
ncbi:MAG: 2-phospho-L-lactate guanylyltransferase [Acidothermaceae bacterium]